eukprot:SAG11_NODE_3290_length_2550_cov_9.647083_2_plen_218_part_00
MGSFPRELRLHLKFESASDTQPRVYHLGSWLQVLISLHSLWSCRPPSYGRLAPTKLEAAGYSSVNSLSLRYQVGGLRVSRVVCVFHRRQFTGVRCLADNVVHTIQVDVVGLVLSTYRDEIPSSCLISFIVTCASPCQRMYQHCSNGDALLTTSRWEGFMARNNLSGPFSVFRYCSGLSTPILSADGVVWSSFSILALFGNIMKYSSADSINPSNSLV